MMATLPSVTHVVEFGGEIIAQGPNELVVLRNAIENFQQRKLIPKSLKKYTIPPRGIQSTGHVEPIVRVNEEIG